MEYTKNEGVIKTTSGELIPVDQNDARYREVLSSGVLVAAYTPSLTDAKTDKLAEDFKALVMAAQTKLSTLTDQVSAASDNAAVAAIVW